MASPNRSTGIHFSGDVPFHTLAAHEHAEHERVHPIGGPALPNTEELHSALDTKPDNRSPANVSTIANYMVETHNPRFGQEITATAGYTYQEYELLLFVVDNAVATRAPTAPMSRDVVPQSVNNFVVLEHNPTNSARERTHALAVDMYLRARAAALVQRQWAPDTLTQQEAQLIVDATDQRIGAMGIDYVQDEILSNLDPSVTSPSAITDIGGSAKPKTRQKLQDTATIQIASIPNYLQERYKQHVEELNKAYQTIDEQLDVQAGQRTFLTGDLSPLHPVESLRTLASSFNPARVVNEPWMRDRVILGAHKGIAKKEKSTGFLKGYNRLQQPREVAEVLLIGALALRADTTSGFVALSAASTVEMVLDGSEGTLYYLSHRIKRAKNAIIERRSKVPAVDTPSFDERLARTEARKSEPVDESDIIDPAPRLSAVQSVEQTNEDFDRKEKLGKNIGTRFGRFAVKMALFSTVWFIAEHSSLEANSTNTPEVESLIDSDGDGDPDQSEDLYGGDKNDPDVTTDRDGDGFGALAEMQAGTDNNDPTDTPTGQGQVEVPKGADDISELEAECRAKARFNNQDPDQVC